MSFGTIIATLPSDSQRLDDLTRMDIDQFINMEEEATRPLTLVRTASTTKQRGSRANDGGSSSVEDAIDRLGLLMELLQLRVRRFFSILDPEQKGRIPPSEVGLGLRLLGVYAPKRGDRLTGPEMETILQALAVRTGGKDLSLSDLEALLAEEDKTRRGEGATKTRRRRRGGATGEGSDGGGDAGSVEERAAKGLEQWREEEVEQDEEGAGEGDGWLSGLEEVKDGPFRPVQANCVPLCGGQLSGGGGHNDAGEDEALTRYDVPTGQQDQQHEAVPSLLPEYLARKLQVIRAKTAHFTNRVNNNECEPGELEEAPKRTMRPDCTTTAGAPVSHSSSSRSPRRAPPHSDRPHQTLVVPTKEAGGKRDTEVQQDAPRKEKQPVVGSEKVAAPAEHHRSIPVQRQQEHQKKHVPLTTAKGNGTARQPPSSNELTRHSNASSTPPPPPPPPSAATLPPQAHHKRVNSTNQSQLGSDAQTQQTAASARPLRGGSPTPPSHSRLVGAASPPRDHPAAAAVQVARRSSIPVVATAANRSSSGPQANATAQARPEPAGLAAPPSPPTPPPPPTPPSTSPPRPKHPKRRAPPAPPALSVNAAPPPSAKATGNARPGAGSPIRPRVPSLASSETDHIVVKPKDPSSLSPHCVMVEEGLRKSLWLDEEPAFRVQGLRDPRHRSISQLLHAVRVSTWRRFDEDQLTV